MSTRILTVIEGNSEYITFRVPAFIIEYDLIYANGFLFTKIVTSR